MLFSKPKKSQKALIFCYNYSVNKSSNNYNESVNDNKHTLSYKHPSLMNFRFYDYYMIRQNKITFLNYVH